MPATPEQLLARLAEIRALREQHDAAVYLLDRERLELLAELRRTGWKPPGVEGKP